MFPNVDMFYSPGHRSIKDDASFHCYAPKDPIVMQRFSADS